MLAIYDRSADSILQKTARVYFPTLSFKTSVIFGFLTLNHESSNVITIVRLVGWWHSSVIRIFRCILVYSRGRAWGDSRGFLVRQKRVRGNRSSTADRPSKRRRPRGLTLDFSTSARPSRRRGIADPDAFREIKPLISGAQKRRAASPWLQARRNNVIHRR